MDLKAGKRKKLVEKALDEYEKPLLRYTKRMVGDLDRARDVVQYAFLQLWQQDPDKVKENLSAWLYRVCRNRALDILRRDGREVDSEPETEHWEAKGPLPSDAMEQKQTTAQVLKLIKTLPAKQREVLYLKFNEGLSYKEISELTGNSVSNVGFLIHAGVKAIRNQLGNNGRGDHD